MSKIIAFAGKGGVGKTTVASLVIRHLANNGKGPILAVDADPNSNLGETLGLDVETTIGDIRENFMRDPQGVPSGMDKTIYLRRASGAGRRGPTRRADCPLSCSVRRTRPA